MSKKGFTVIELIVVIAIIAILAGIVVTVVNIQLKNARNAKIKGDFSQISKGMAMYFADHNNSYQNYTLPINYSPCSTAYTLAQNGSAYVLSVQMCGSSNYWCVDSTGKTAELTGAPNVSQNGYICKTASAIVCGNGSCQTGETCKTCPRDCGGTQHYLEAYLQNRQLASAIKNQLASAEGSESAWCCDDGACDSGDPDPSICPDCFMSGCVDNTDCDFPSYKCEDGQCVVNNQNPSQCESNYDCNGRICDMGECRDCTETDCPEGYLCEPDGTCSDESLP